MRRILLVFVTVLTVAAFAAAESPANADGKARAITTAIDNALDADWAARSITPAVVATDAEFARRLYLDLIGRIPTVSEVRFFEDDKTAGKRARLVDKLLKKPGYATQMARVLREAWLPETLTDINVQFLGLQYETWLRKQLIAKTPLDKIVHKTLTAKLQVGGRRNFRGASSDEPEDDDAPIQSFYDAAQSKPENLGSTVTRAFLGVKLVILTFVLSSMIGGVVATMLVVTRRADMATRVPFGTMLAAAALAASLYGERLMAWYLSTM